MMWPSGWGNWILASVMMVLFWGGLIVLAILAMRGWGADRREHASTSEPPGARRILEERFARGEISEDEFVQRRQVLENTAR